MKVVDYFLKISWTCPDCGTLNTDHITSEEYESLDMVEGNCLFCNFAVKFKA